MNIIFVVAGRLGKSLIASKILPLIELHFFDRILIFSEEPGYKMGNVEYICLPKEITKRKNRLIRKALRVIYEPVQLLIYSLSLKPTYINGLYTNPKGFNSFIVSKISRSRCIISVIGGQLEIETSFYYKKISVWLNIFILKRCYRVFTKGQKDNQYLISKGVAKDKLLIFNGAINLNRFFYQNEIKNIDLIFIGYFDENKGPSKFINICSKLLFEKPGIIAYMLGSGPKFNEMVDLVEMLGLTGDIKLLGRIEDVEHYLKRSKIFVLPSKSEGLSTAMLEAMSCGCVPVVSDVGNNCEAADHGINSFLVKDYEDINEYSNYILQLFSDTYLWQKLSSNAIETIANEYSPESQSNILLNVYE